DRRNDWRTQPPRTYGSNRDQNFVGPLQNPPTVTATATSPSPAVTSANPPPPRRYDPGRTRNGYDSSGDRPNRSPTFQNPPVVNPAPVATAPSNYPYGAPPASHIVPAFTGPIVGPMPSATSQP